MNRFVGFGATTVHVALSGGLGREVADELRSALVAAGHGVAIGSANSVRPGTPGVGGPETGNSIGLLVADHDDPAIAEFTDMWRAGGRPSLVVVQNHPDVRIGPLDVPSSDLCAWCFRTRDRQDQDVVAVDSGPGGDLALTVDGFPPYLVSLVVALIMERLAVLDEDLEKQRNEVTMVNTASLLTRVLPVVPVDHCPQCSDQQPEAALGVRRAMFPDLDRVPR